MTAAPIRERPLLCKKVIQRLHGESLVLGTDGDDLTNEETLGCLRVPPGRNTPEGLETLGLANRRSAARPSQSYRIAFRPGSAPNAHHHGARLVVLHGRQHMPLRVGQHGNQLVSHPRALFTSQSVGGSLSTRPT